MGLEPLTPPLAFARRVTVGAPEETLRQRLLLGALELLLCEYSATS